MSRSMRLDGRSQHIKLVHALMVAVGVILGYFHRLEVFKTRFLDDFVFAFVGVVVQMPHVGDVAHVILSYTKADIKLLSLTKEGIVDLDELESNINANTRLMFWEDSSSSIFFPTTISFRT